MCWRMMINILNANFVSITLIHSLNGIVAMDVHLDVFPFKLSILSRIRRRFRWIRRLWRFVEISFHMFRIEYIVEYVDIQYKR